MRLAKVALPDGQIGIGVVDEDQVRVLDLRRRSGIRSLSDVFAAEDPEQIVTELLRDSSASQPIETVTLLAPIDQQEVWGAGVTYLRSREARQEESETGGDFYAQVYTADRPELFLKAVPRRVVGPGQAVRIRRDSRWSVPEPEVALVISPRFQLVGLTIGNDMSARDIEGANPLYLPQAKVYDACCALGPVVTLARDMPPPAETTISLQIRRGGQVVFDGSTSLGQMRRGFPELIDWLARDNSFPDGVILLTGTGIVPPDDFSLKAEDEIAISVTGIGTLTNVVEQRRGS